MQQLLTNAPVKQGIPKAGLKLLTDCIIGNLTSKADRCKAATNRGAKSPAAYSSDGNSNTRRQATIAFQD
jgi:hypothetical protein